MEARLKHATRRFQTNLEYWSKTDPKHAITLQFLDTEGYAFDRTAKDELNLFHDGYYHDQSGAEAEATAWFEKQKLDDCPLLYVYGVGLGYLYTAAKQWLKQSKSHQLVFLEDDLKVIAMLFQTPLGKELLQDKQVQLHYFHSVKDSPYVFELLFWKFLNVSFNVAALPWYEKQNSECFEELKHKLIYDAAVKNAILDEYLKFGVAFFRNFYPNMLCLPGSYRGSGLFGKFTGIPAIICGAGPSISKHLDLLKQLDTRALLFAGGSALNALNSAGVMPHFGAGVDPNPPQLERYLTNTSYELPFFYRSRLFHPALELLHGPRLYLNGCGGYDIPKYFEERLGIEGEELDEGHNIVNFLVGLAHALGCYPIILIGVDLAFTGKHQYAPGVIAESGIDIEAMMQAPRYDDRPLLKEDIYGQPIYTLWKWIAESEYISMYAQNHPDVKILNATEGGLGFPNVLNEPLAKLVKEYCTREWDLRGIIHSQIQQCTLPQANGEKILELMKDMQASLARCKDHIDFLRKEGKEALKNSKLSQLTDFESGEAVLHQIELAEEIGFQYLLHHFNEAYNWVLQSEFDKLVKMKSDQKRERKKLQIQDRKYRYLEHVLKTNRLVIEWALKEHPMPHTAHQAEAGGLEAIPEGISSHVEIVDQRGQLLSSSRFDQGQRNGETKLWYSSGALYAIERYEKGVRHGKQEYFYEDGTPKSMIPYTHGAISGETILYKPDGSIKRAID